MPLIRVSYDPSRGPLLDIEIAYPVALWHGSSPRPSVSVTFMVDTGASATHISPLVMNNLSIAPTGQKPVRFANGQQTIVHTYPIDLIFSVGGVSTEIPSIEAREFAPFNVNFDGLLGRDVLNRCNLRIDGIANELFLLVH